MNFLAISLLTLWHVDPVQPDVDTITIPVANMVRRQRQDAVDDIQVWIQAELERSAELYLKRRDLRPQPRGLASSPLANQEAHRSGPRA